MLQSVSTFLLKKEKTPDRKYYKLTISVGENGSVSTVYNVGRIKKDTLPNGKIKTIYSGSKANSMSDISISQKTDLSTDSEEKVPEMRKYDIVDSELNADGEVKDEYFEKVLEKNLQKSCKKWRIRFIV